MPETAQPDNVMQALNGIGFDSFRDPASRKEALASARALVTRLETPIETMIHMSHEIPALYSALKVAMDQGVFDTLDQEGGSPKSPQQLAREGDSALLNRFLRHLAAMNITGQADPNLYTPTRHYSALRNPTINAAVNYFKDVTTVAFDSLPGFLEHTDFKNPDSAAYSNWQYMLGKNESHFQWLAEHPAVERNFANLMAGYTSQRGSWLDVYPGQDILENAYSSGPLLVDVGGGMGQDLAKFLQKYPQSAGRLVLQDLPQVIQAVEGTVPAAMKAEPYDFFTPEPVRGNINPATNPAQVSQADGNKAQELISCTAFSMINDKGHDILANLKSAMKLGYSRLLVNELVIASSKATAYSMTVDLTMAALFSGRERGEGDWTAFLSSAGFKVITFWQGLGASEAVIEAEPV